jgi:hypothetical protein
MGTEKSSKHGKNDWDRFKTFKQRGEWVELQFMAEAAKHRFAVSKSPHFHLAERSAIDVSPLETIA